MLTPKQQTRLDTIKVRLKEQLSVINSDKLKLPTKEEEITALYDLLDIEFNKFLDAISNYFEATNNFDPVKNYNKISVLLKTKRSLSEQLGVLVEKNARIPHQYKPIIFIPNERNVTRILTIEENHREQIESIEQEIKKYRNEAQSAKEAKPIFDKKIDYFNSRCLSLLSENKRNLAPYGHGNYNDTLNYLIMLISCLCSMFKKLHIETPVEKILTTMEHNINVAAQKARPINLVEEINEDDTPSFQSLL